MFNRVAYEYLVEWRHGPNRRPLIIRGGRQVGKSTLIKMVGSEFREFVKLNLERERDRYFFENFDDPKDILEAIAVREGLSLEPASTLLFIDEIQECPPAINMLRYFYEDIPELYVIAAGSLLEVVLKRIRAFPVGRVEQIVLHPLSFEEFLNAIGAHAALAGFKQIPLKSIAYKTLLDYFHRYLIIGGMPEIIQTYISNGQRISGLDKTYALLWNAYQDDVEKYAESNTMARVIRHIMHTAPFVRDRIIYAGFGSSQYKSREVGEAFRALDLARVIKIMLPTTAIAPPALPDLKRRPRLQFLDTGLRNYASGLQGEMLYLTDFTDFYRGQIVYHMVVQEVIAQQNSIRFNPLFWVREKANSNAEVDLVYKWRNLLIPVEVKSGSKGSLRSLHEFVDRAPHPFAIRLLQNELLIEKGVTRSGKEYYLLNMPYFLAGELEKYIDWFIKETQGRIGAFAEDE